MFYCHLLLFIATTLPLNPSSIFANPSKTLASIGAAGVNRTPDLLITNQLLYQLSYNGNVVNYIRFITRLSIDTVLKFLDLLCCHIRGMLLSPYFYSIFPLRLIQACVSIFYCFLECLLYFHSKQLLFLNYPHVIHVSSYKANDWCNL